MYISFIKNITMDINNIFESKGFFKDYFLDGKFIGSLINVEQDRDVFGYYGRKKEVLTENIKFKNKTIKKGTIVTTELQVICGKTIEDFSFCK